MSAHEKHTIDRAKLKHVILYFLEHINNVHLGRTKLMKLLYYVDFDHYEKYGSPVTNAKYRKLPHGPVPDDADKVISDMVSAQEVEAVRVERGKFEQERLVTTQAKFDPSLFSGDEIDILEKVAARWSDATGAEISRASHDEAPWAASQMGKTIDYEMAQYRTPLNEDDGVDDALAGSPAFRKFVSTLE